MPQLKLCLGCARTRLPDPGPTYCSKPSCKAKAPKPTSTRQARTRGRAGQARRQRILERDGHQCTWPGCSRTDKLAIHHVQSIEDRPDLENVDTNLVTLCPTHHREATAAYEAARNRRRRRF